MVTSESERKSLRGPALWVARLGSQCLAQVASPSTWVTWRGGTLGGHHCTRTAQTSSSSTPHPPPQPRLLPVNGGPCLSLIVATHLATLSMICLPSCCFSNTQTHLEAVLLRQRVIGMAPKIKPESYNCKTGVA